MKLRLVLVLGAALVMGIAVSAALAGRPGAGLCTGGTIAGGTYDGLTVTGTCFFAGDPITVDGNLTIEDGASLNAHAATFAVVHVTGNVIVGKGAVLGLGKYGPGGPPGQSLTGTVVDGNILADQPASLYLSAITVHGNLVSNGGSGPGLNFPTKNNVIDGNVVIQGWSGLWIGLLRNQVGGNVIFSHNSGTQVGEGPYEGVPDSSEVADNVVHGNLICQGNDPAAQLGDSVGLGGGPNTVDGKAVGQCATLVG